MDPYNRILAEEFLYASYLNSIVTAHDVVDSVIAAHEMDLPLSPSERSWGKTSLPPWAKRDPTSPWTACSARLHLTPAALFDAPLNSLPGISDALYDFMMGTPVTGFDRPIFLCVGLLDRDVPPSST